MPSAVGAERRFGHTNPQNKMTVRPSLRQLVALHLFGYRGPEPRTRREAAQLIEYFLDRKGGRHG